MQWVFPGRPTENEVILEVYLPGVRKQEIRIEVKNGSVLVLKGDWKPVEEKQEDGYLRKEAKFHCFYRAFARKRREYDAHLAMADQPRKNDLDGRGPLSEENLLKFCIFFLRCCADQIHFMDGMLKLGELERRYRRFIEGLVAEKQLSKAGTKVMERLFMQGEIPRAQVLKICDVKQRRATQIVKELLDAKITRSETAYGPLRLNISADMVAVLFPELA
ncbi:MAG: Hsp20/alpha crystallin family protein [Elusimicrobia bacterium]|nr:Hsp20/alpha crystallin family protein [Elusimicrobiota bacterium]